MPAGIRQCKKLLAAVSDCGATPPQRLTDLMLGLDSLNTAADVTDPLDALVDTIASGRQLTPSEIDTAITEAWTTQGVNEFRATLQRRAEHAIVKKFVRTLDAGGAADEIIASLTPAFTAAVEALMACKEHIDPNTSADAFIATADAKSLKGWRSIEEHLAVIAKIAGIVTQFGPRSTTFPLMTIRQFPGHERITDRGLLCTKPEYNLDQASTALRANGTHRDSPWYRLAGTLQLCTIEEARERIRAWHEAAFKANVSDAGRGRMTESGFVAEPIANPYTLAEATA